MIADETLGQQAKYGLFLAAAIATRNPDVIAAVEAEAAGKLSEPAIAAAKAAAVMMAMNNVYYRFVHLASNKEYATMPARLRMNVIANPGVDKADFELWCARGLGDQRLRRVHRFARKDPEARRRFRRRDSCRGAFRSDHPVSCGRARSGVASITQRVVGASVRECSRRRRVEYCAPPLTLR